MEKLDVFKDFIDLLTKYGFTYNEDNDTWYYDYSDFETLSFNVQPHTKVDGSKCLKISNLRCEDYLQNLTHFTINYDLYLKSPSKFIDLMNCLNYPFVKFY